MISISIGVGEFLYPPSYPKNLKELSIDLETYSDVDISKCGAYKYAESDNFDILLFGVSVDGSTVNVYDLACGDTVPEEILAALSDENYPSGTSKSNFFLLPKVPWRAHIPIFEKKSGRQSNQTLSALVIARCTL